MGERLTETGRKRRPNTYHRFLDEAGDTTFFGKGRVLILGQEGVSKAFILGMLGFTEPLEPVRERIMALQKSIAANPYYTAIRNVQKKVDTCGYYLHAKDDPPEIRKEAYDLIRTLKCSCQVVVARKVPRIFKNQHGEKEDLFYADMLGHLLKDKIKKDLVLNVSERGTSTTNTNLQRGLIRAKERYEGKHKVDVQVGDIEFNVQRPTTEPILNIADYFCWAVQRVFERGETRFYEYIKDQVSLVVDLYDEAKYDGHLNYYGPSNPLTAANQL